MHFAFFLSVSSFFGQKTDCSLFFDQNYHSYSRVSVFVVK